VVFNFSGLLFIGLFLFGEMSNLYTTEILRSINTLFGVCDSDSYCDYDTDNGSGSRSGFSPTWAIELRKFQSFLMSLIALTQKVYFVEASS